MPTGYTNTYDLVTGLQLDIENMIHQLDPADVPLQGGQGVGAELALPMGPCFEKKVSWLDEELLTPSTTLAAVLVTAATEMTVASGERTKFQTGDVVKIGSEYIRVTGYSSAADVLNITRAYSGSAAQHSNGAAVTGVGSALPEGSAPPDARFLDRNERTNVTQIFGPYGVETSESDQAVRKYGVGDEFGHQAANRIKEAGVAIDQAAVYGVRVEDTTNRWRSMGGMDYYITTNASTVTDLTEAAENAQLQAIYNAGGSVDILMVGASQKVKVSAWTSSSTINIDRASNTRGLVVNVFESDFGTVRILLNRWLRLENAYNFSRDQMEFCTLRPLTFEMLAKTKDTRQGMIVCEKTFKVRRERHAGKFTALQ